MTFLDITDRLSHFFNSHNLPPPRVTLTFETITDAHRALNVIYNDFTIFLSKQSATIPPRGPIEIHGITFDILPLGDWK